MSVLRFSVIVPHFSLRVSYRRLNYGLLFGNADHLTNHTQTILRIFGGRGGGDFPAFSLKCEPRLPSYVSYTGMTSFLILFRYLIGLRCKFITTKTANTIESKFAANITKYCISIIPASKETFRRLALV